MNIHFILHETFEVPGAYLKWAQDRGHNITSTKVYEEEVLPETVEGIDFLIVMGGPQSPDEDCQAFPYYDPEAEIAFMQKAIAADIYIVGVCLGAQLLSVAYGGKYEHSPEREIGVFPITLTDDGLADEHVKGFGTTLNTGHWHGDMPGLTDNAVVLAMHHQSIQSPPHRQWHNYAYAVPNPSEKRPYYHANNRNRIHCWYQK